MNIPARHDVRSLTEKEKQTLRLIVRGHDAKSAARTLGLSVHTINERLRDARRKMAVSSSREAARLLLDAETAGEASPPVRSPPPESVGDDEIGADATAHRAHPETAPDDGVGWAGRRPRTMIGGLFMTFALGLLALITLPQSASTPPPAPVAPSAATDPVAVTTARQWLALLDQARWEDSYRATGTAFRRLNTLQVWTATSEKVRLPLGDALSRTFVSQENLPAPPAGYEVMKFRTRFANGAEAIETVTLDREDGAWRVVGVTIG